jgi:hypothetical protein
MFSLDNVFAELLSKIRNPEALNPAKSDPIFYFSYPPEQMLALKKHLPRWTTKIREAGFSVKRVSLSDLMWRLIDESGRWEAWLEAEKEAEPDQINEAIRDVLRQGDALVRLVSEAVQSASPDTMVLVTEAELLHPYFRTRILEQYMHDRVSAPTVIFYPGEHSGQFGLKFLGFYPVDSNYRSTIIGGLQ